MINAYTYPSGSFDEISIDIQQTSNFFVIMLALLRTKFLLPTFYVFSESFQKNVKSHVFFKSEKNEKYVFSNTECRLLYNQCLCQREVGHGGKKTRRLRCLYRLLS